MRVLILLVALILSWEIKAETLSSIDVFYTESQSVQVLNSVNGVKPKYFNLDSSRLQQEKINLNMPSNLKAASNYMSRFANSDKGKQVIRTIVDGYQGVGEAFRLSVRELPAVVINKKYVVYGTVDAKRAVSLSIEKGVIDEK